MNNSNSKSNSSSTEFNDSIDGYSIKCNVAERENELELRRELGRQSYFFKKILEELSGEWYQSMGSDYD